nr:CBS domain-containing protein [Spirochaetaceae bacterium]
MGFFKKIFAGKKDEEGSGSDAGSHSTDKLTEEILNEEKRDMIRGIEDLSQTSVKEVMIPRIDVDFIPLNCTEEELLLLVAESGHSRFPVYSDSIDNVVGVLYVKDLIKVLLRHDPVDLEKITRKAFFVPETKRIDTLL